MKTIITVAAALAALSVPAVALAQTTGTRLPSNVTVVDDVTVIGAIEDETAPSQGEDPADAATAELPTVYEDAAETASAPTTPARAD